MVERVSMINSNNTQLNSDYDYSKLLRYVLGDQDGVLYSDFSSKPEFDLDLGAGEISAGTAIILCTRSASQPIANQKFYAIYQSDETLSVNVNVGQKIFIEIDDTLIQDPTLIDDTSPSTTYARGLGIGQIKSETTYPSHGNYIKLWEVTSGPTAVDMREIPGVVKETMTTLDVLKLVGNANKVLYLDGDGEGKELGFSTDGTVLGMSGGNLAFISPNVDINSLDALSGGLASLDRLVVFDESEGTNVKVPAIADQDNAGLVELVTNAEGEALSSDALALTPQSLLFFFNIVAGSTIVASDDPQENTTSATYVKMKEFTINRSGTYTIGFTMASGDPGSYTLYGRIYKNGVAFGTERTGPATYNENLAFAEGDTCELRARINIVSGSPQNKLSNFRVKCDLALNTSLAPTPPTGTTIFAENV